MKNLCGNHLVLAWGSLAGLVAALTHPGYVLLYAYIPYGGSAVLPLVASYGLVAGVLAANFSLCRAYLGFKTYLISAIYVFTAFAIPASMVSTIMYGSWVSALSAAIDSLILALVSALEASMLSIGFDSIKWLIEERLDDLILSGLLLASSLPIYMNMGGLLAALIVAVSYYPIYNSVASYVRENGLSWGMLTHQEKLFISSLTLFYVSLAAAYSLL